MRTCAGANWRPISLAGPERLPATSGGATAFEFRDPEGHPLELSQFEAAAVPSLWRTRFEAKPQHIFFGSDHTAITVSSNQTSTRFWTSLGLAVVQRHANRGPEQARLDGFASAASAEVEIASLSAGVRPGLELLAYRDPPTTTRAAADGSTAATAIIVRQGPTGRDPDGHRLEVR